MKLYKVGEKSRAICSFCEQVRPTTFEERDVPLSSGKGMVSNVLAGVCDHCHNVITIPQQSVPKIQEEVARSRKPIEARIPRHLQDALNFACHDLGYRSDSSAVLFRYYVRRAVEEKRLRSQLFTLAFSEEAAGAASARFSAKLNDQLYDMFVGLTKAANLNTAGIVKALILLVKKDVLDDRREDVRSDLQAALQVSG